MTLRLRPQRAVVRDAADDILALVLRLRDDRSVDIAGIAAAARLVDDRRLASSRRKPPDHPRDSEVRNAAPSTQMSRGRGSGEVS